jgi:ribosomal RNA-processing protein 1
MDALKLWKGLFYSLWMCDRPIPQQNLCAELGELVFTVHTQCAIPWLQGFWGIMSMQWTDIDVLRMEKFMLLVRRVFGASLRWVWEMKWETKAMEDMLEVFSTWPFELEGDLSRVPVGLRLHVLDIWADELDKAKLLGEDSPEPAQEFVKKIIAMVESLAKSSPCKPVRVRAKDSLENEKLPGSEKEKDNETSDPGEDVDDDGSWDGIED